MTKKETDMYEKLTTLLEKNMEVQAQLLALLNGTMVETGGIQDVEVEPTEPAKPNIPEPAPEPEVKYTIEMCRDVLGRMVDVLGEDRARNYLATFHNAQLVTDLDPTDYEELYLGGEEQLANVAKLG